MALRSIRFRIDIWQVWQFMPAVSHLRVWVYWMVGIVSPVSHIYLNLPQYDLAFKGLSCNNAIVVEVCVILVKGISKSE